MRKVALSPTALLIAMTMLLASACSTTSLSPAGIAANATTESANVVIYRPREASDISGLTYTLYVDGKDSGRLRSQRCLKLSLSPGKHILESSAATSRAVTIDVESADATLWIEAQIIAVPEYGLLLTPVSKQHAEKKLPALAEK